MSQVQQKIMCVLLQTLLEKGLISQDVHDQARNKVLGTLDWPEFFCYAEDDRKEETYGST